MLRPFVTLGLVVFLSASALAERVTVDPPMKLLTYRADRSEVSGLLVAYDETEFELRDARGKTTTVAWDELDPKSILQVHTRLLAKGTGTQWLELGERLLQFRNGGPSADRAFATAVRLDPSLKTQVEAARKTAAAAQRDGESPLAAATPTDTRSDEPGRGRGREMEEPATPAPEVRGIESTVGPDSTAAAHSEPPKTVGQVQEDFWGPQSAEAQAAAVTKLKSFAAETRQRVSPDIVPYETEFFLLYSDLRSREAQRWQGELDRMYERLSELFGLSAGQNIWRGKALVFIFSKESDYHAFCEKMQGGARREDSAGVCYQMGDGFVHIAFYRQPHALTFAHVLVHESVHGFLHRYKSSARIPTWANEGLAEVIAYELVPERGRQQQFANYARDQIRSHRGLGEDFFSGGGIEGWQYPIAHTLCEFMIRQNKKGYVDFINGIKEGLKWEQSLEQRYGAPLERLVPAYAESLGVKAQQLDSP
jgi:hypothetical protein